MNTSRCTKAFSRLLTHANFRLAFALIVSLIVLAGAGANASAATITVNSGGDFQAALNAAQPGDTIVLQAGASFMGPFTLPVKSGASYITIRTSAPDSSLPASNERVTAAHSSVMPKLLAPATAEAAVRTTLGAHHYKFIGVEFKPGSSSSLVYDLIQLGDGDNVQNQLSQVAHHLILDRCYIHGNPTGQVKRCIAANGAHTSILNSHISDCKGTGFDSQAIGGWNGPGPFTIINNYLEGAGENVMFGGAWAQTGLDPADLEFRRNYVTKQVSWRGVYTVKNLFELKNMRRAVIDGNVFEYNWPHAQSGYAVMFTPASYDSGPNARVEDILFTNNIIRHSAQAIDMTGRDYGDPQYPNTPVQNRRVTIKNNLFYDIGGQWGGDGRFMLLTSGGGPDDLTIDHNTVIHSGAVLVLDGGPQARFVFNNNLMAHNDYGVIAVGWLGSGFGAAALNLYAPGYVFRRNLIAGANQSTFPADNFYPSSLDSAGFIDRAANNYRLSASSPYKNAGTDGKDIGCDFDALNAAQAGTVVPGPSPSPTATPTPTPTPSPSPSPTPSATPGVGFVDDFNDNVFDPAKWIYNTIQGAIYSGSSAWDATVPVLERNQRVEISPRSNVSGDHYNGYVFANAWNMTNSRATVEVIQSAVSTADTNLALCLNSSNFYMISVEGGQLRFEQVINGGRSTTNIAYDAAQHRHWRIRHDPTSDSIIFETSANAQTWTVRRTVVRQLQITSLRAEISAGTWEAISAPGTAVFDNFYLGSNSQLTPLASPMMVASARQLAISLSSVPNPDSASVNALVTSIEQAYTVFVTEYTRFSAGSSIDKNLRSALSYASAAGMGPRSAIRKRLMNATQHLSEAHALMQSTGARDSGAEGVASNTSLDSSGRASPPPVPTGASRRMRAAQFRAR